MYHIFQIVDSSAEYVGLTDNAFAGRNEKLLNENENEFNPNTQDFALVEGEIEITNSAGKQRKYDLFLKDEAIKSVDRDTQKEVAKGFAFDSHKFSLSTPAQINWQRLLWLKNSGLFGTSQEISTLDDRVYTLLTTQLNDFIRVSNEKINSSLVAGRTKKKALKAEGNG